MLKILITDSIHSLFIEEMKDFGAQVMYAPEISRAETLQLISAYDVLLINSRIRADEALFEKANSLKAVARIGSGMEVIDVDAAEQRGIACFNVPEGNKDAVAEHALGMLLCLLNNIHIANQQVKNHEWLREQNRGTELGGMTVGIIGYGNNGSAFAEKLKGFGVQTLAHDKYKKDFGHNYVKECGMKEIFEQADVVSLHLPLTDETKNFADHKFFAAFSKSIYLLNVARGKLVNTSALIPALQSGKVTGACLDVLENENISSLSEEEKIRFETLCEMKNVLLTPHVAGWTHQSKIKIAQGLTTKLKKFMSDLKM